MKARRFAAALCVAPALALAACGGDDDEGGGGGGGGAAKSVTVYSSLPLQGASRDNANAIVQGAKLALEQAGGKAGETTVKYESLDDSTAQAGTWAPEAVQANARKAAQDKTAVAYIGEFNSGGSAISIPILNEAQMPQISPANTGVGLTVSQPPVSEKGEPEKYYPTGKRTYARIVPRDDIQGAALATTMKEDGCTNVAVANDKEVYGAGFARNVEKAAKPLGLKISSSKGIDTKAANYRSVAQEYKAQNVDCFAFAGTTANGGVQIAKDVVAALPQGKIYGPDGICESGFVDPKKGGIPAAVATKFKCTVATLPADALPPEGKAFFAEFSKKYNEKNPDPYAIYGFEAMQLTLDVIKRSGDATKESVLKALFETKDRSSVLGTYSIDKNGDTTLTDYGLYTVADGELEFEKTVKAQPAS